MKTVLILSGKGGVGKSSIAQGLALTLAQNGTEAGLLCVDIENPSLGEMIGIKPKDVEIGAKILPVNWNGVEVMCISLLSDKFDMEDMPVLIDEQRKHLTIDQLLNAVEWTAKVLVIDMPPGQGEEVRAFIPKNVSGIIVVTSPQHLAEKAAARTIQMARHYKMPIIGIVQNNINNIGGDAGHNLSQKYDVPLIAKIPWDKAIPQATELHLPIDTKHFTKIAEVVTNAIQTG